MFTVSDPHIAAILCVITMICWGSWANTQKLAGKERWPFELYYWDYAIGVAVAGVVFFFTLGSFGSTGSSSMSNLDTAATRAMFLAAGSGALFNFANLLLVVSIDAAGMSLAFPMGVGLALVIGTVASYRQAPKGDAALLGSGVFLIVLAMIISAVANSRLRSEKKVRTGRGILFACAAGCLMGFFYPQLMRSISPDFSGAPIQLGYLTPYTALLFFGLGVFVSNFLVNTVFMYSQKSTFAEYRRAQLRLHVLGLAGGVIWMTALTANVIASAVAGPAVSYALGQGATLVAALWGVFVWREFRDAPAGTNPLIALMLIGYASGLVLIGKASL